LAVIFRPNSFCGPHCTSFRNVKIFLILPQLQKITFTHLLLVYCWKSLQAIKPANTEKNKCHPSINNYQFFTFWWIVSIFFWRTWPGIILLWKLCRRTYVWICKHVNNVLQWYIDTIHQKKNCNHVRQYTKREMNMKSDDSFC
jgi:hypothetical protein